VKNSFAYLVVVAGMVVGAAQKPTTVPGAPVKFQDTSELQSAIDPAAVSRAPDIFAAVEGQLGLRLMPATAPREFIVIDYVERPNPD